MLVYLVSFALVSLLLYKIKSIQSEIFFPVQIFLKQLPFEAIFFLYIFAIKPDFSVINSMKFYWNIRNNVRNMSY